MLEAVIFKVVIHKSDLGRVRAVLDTVMNSDERICHDSKLDALMLKNLSCLKETQFKNADFSLYKRYISSEVGSCNNTSTSLSRIKLIHV